VLLAGIGIAAGYLRQGDDRRDAPGAAPILPGTPATPSAAASATAAPAAAGFSPVVCDREPPANAARTPQRGAARDVNGWALAPGYSYWADPNGFHIGVPDGWTVERIGTTVCFRDPDNVRILSLDYGRNPKGDPVAACRNEAARLLGAGVLRNYQQVGEIEPVKLLKKAADWEYRYTGANDVRMHAKTRWFANDGAAFALGWITRDFDWDPNQAAYSFIVSTFYRETPSGRRATPSR
jgi:hypothetical protein